MKRILFVAAVAAGLPLSSLAQAAKPASKPTAKPAAKPAARPATAPAAKPVARPVSAAPAPSPSQPAPRSKPAGAASLTDAFAEGTNVLSLGIGLGSRWGYGAGLFGGSSSVSPAFSLGYERGVLALGPGYLGVGAVLGYQGASYDLGYGSQWRYSDVLLTVRGAFHYGFVPQLDTYAGLSLGARYLRATYDDGTGSTGAGSSTDAVAGLYLGARYYFTPAIGAFAELGYDQSYFKLGVAAKF